MFNGLLEGDLVLQPKQCPDLAGFKVGNGTAGGHIVEFGDVTCQLVPVRSIDEPVDTGGVFSGVSVRRVDSVDPRHDFHRLRRQHVSDIDDEATCVDVAGDRSSTGVEVVEPPVIELGIDAPALVLGDQEGGIGGSSRTRSR